MGRLKVWLEDKEGKLTFPMIPPQVNGATYRRCGLETNGRIRVSNDSAPS